MTTELDQGSANGHEKRLGDVEKKRVLVIDDDLPLRGMLAAALRQHGFMVLLAGDGAEGQRALTIHTSTSDAASDCYRFFCASTASARRSPASTSTRARARSRAKRRRGIATSSSSPAMRGASCRRIRTS